MDKKLTINNLIRKNGGCFIIAEAGVNHNGRLDYAIKLVDEAAKIRADAIKFQTFKAEDVVIPSCKITRNQERNLGVKKSQRDMLKDLELPEEYYPIIIERCKKRNLIFLSTPHGGKKSVDLLEQLDISVYKISSGDLTNYILLDYVAKTKKAIILSTGMATLREVKEAIKFIYSRGNRQVAALHSTTNYPCSFDEVNLNAMLTMKTELNVPVGYSDHTEGIQVAIMMATLGASIYEFHLTLDKKLSGPDHAASINPEEAKARIDAVRKTSIILGNGIKKPYPSELDSIIECRKSIVASKHLNKGHVLTEEDIEAKRPSRGVSPTEYMNFIGKTLKCDVKKDQPLQFKDL